MKKIAKNKINNTVLYFLFNNSEKNNKNKALLSSNGSEFDFNRLFEQIFDLVQKLKSFGISKNDRIALVFPQGIEMAVACLAGISCAAIAPLNPGYTKKEFEFYLSDVAPKILLTLSGFESVAEEVAEENNIPVIKLFSINKTNRVFFDLSLKDNKPKKINFVFPSENDTALLLHTSGTTAKPKLVPLTQKNIIISAKNTVKTLKLTGKDLCLNTMPLFHIHGFVVMIASLLAGGGMIAAGKFNRRDFFAGLNKHKPTWYTGGPAIHHEIVAAAEKNKDLIKVKIKKIRSSSAPLPAETIKKLEKIFEAPVLESYGMTEAALQITSNQLPPGKRKPGSAGLADGPKLKIVNEKGKILPSGEIGEIIVKGENIMSGYQNNPQANKESFLNGWFKTGDLGYLDKDNYLFIKGRIKEMINKGGQKISPREIDEALLSHPSVKQAAAFSMPHKSLGEEVAAAVVLFNSSKINEDGLKKYLRKYLSEFKIPKKIIFLKNIPKGPTGKIKRTELYNDLKSSFAIKYIKPLEKIESIIAKTWQEVLGLKKIGLDDNFFEIGGNSLQMAELISKLKEKNIDLKIEDLLDRPTIRGLVKKNKISL
jgi:acyl-CoA synthetase (AMP-forming)/AMP-acid ligase II/aryl carrier-like protein